MLKNIIRLYLMGAILVPTVAVAYCFIWYRVEYYMAVDLYPEQSARAEIHRNNSLWLGLWGGVYGIVSTTAAGFLLHDLRSAQAIKQGLKSKSEEQQ